MAEKIEKRFRKGSADAFAEDMDTGQVPMRQLLFSFLLLMSILWRSKTRLDRVWRSPRGGGGLAPGREGELA